MAYIDRYGFMWEKKLYLQVALPLEIQIDFNHISNSKRTSAINSTKKKKEKTRIDEYM